MSPLALPRRSFLIAMGLSAGGLVVGVAGAQQKKKPASSETKRPTFAQLPAEGLLANAFVHVAGDGAVSIVCARSEMGQGVRSSLPVLVADEIGADMARVRVVQADGDEAYGNQDTDGSSSVRGSMYGDLRRAGAAARMLLVAAAAARWKVPPAGGDARGGEVLHAKSHRRAPFGELVTDAAKLPLPADDAITLRPRSELLHVGKPLPHLDAPDVVTGRAIYGADVRLPGMLVAVVARPPVPGGKLARFDGAKALATPGVKKVLPLPALELPFKFQPLGGVAVLATDTWSALRGRAALDLAWEPGPNGGYDSVAYEAELTASASRPGKVVRHTGDVDGALGASGGTRVGATYATPHLAHASMEPPVSLASYDAAKRTCEVWSPTQSPQDVRTEVAHALGLETDHVRVHVTILGGAFGRKAKPDYDVEAALLSRDAGVPVRVQWSREDDLRHDYFHTTCVQALDAKLDDRGKVLAWRHRAAFPPIASTFSGASVPTDGEMGQGILDFPVDSPNVRAEACEAHAHARIGWLRSVSNIPHAFALGSFVDEIAHARGVDPRDAWLDVVGPSRQPTLSDLGLAKLPNYGASLEDHPVDVGRLRHCIERVTALARWSDRARERRALGLAAHRSFLTCVAVVASVIKDDRGRIHVDEGWVVIDAGLVINPDRVLSQVEGAFVFGVGVALTSAITMKNGVVQQPNFRDFRVPRIGDAPRAVHVEIVESDAKPCGVGEPGLPPVAPAIANAVFALTGYRARKLPIVVPE